MSCSLEETVRLGGAVRHCEGHILKREERLVAMRVRLRLLFTSFNRAIAEYVLARLELSLVNPEAATAPLVARLGAYLPLDDGLRDSWPRAHAQVREAQAFIGAVERDEIAVRRDEVWERFDFSVRQMAQYASGIDWLQTSIRSKSDDVSP
jgi:hypothetical protein